MSRDENWVSCCWPICKIKMIIWMVLEPKNKNFISPEMRIKKNFNSRRHMSITRAFERYYFQAILNWWHSPFKVAHCRRTDRKEPAIRSVIHQACNYLTRPKRRRTKTYTYIFYNPSCIVNPINIWYTCSGHGYHAEGVVWYQQSCFSLYHI